MLDVVSSSNALHIVRNALNHIDPRLVGHGERVAFMVHRILRQEGICEESERLQRTYAAILHDVGAYKTEEIDNMMEFESGRVWEHSVYGYLFVKHFSPWADQAEELLYHHLSAKHYERFGFSGKENRFAALLYLVDRFDVWATRHDRDFCLNNLRRYAASFSPYWLELFYAAEQEQRLYDRLRDGSCYEEIDGILNKAELSAEEKRQFLHMMAYTIDFRSETTVSHTITTLTLSNTVAELMGLEALERERVYYGALLHDMGKITTPLSILEKPDKLTAEEMVVMRQHVVLTRELLSCCLDDQPVIEIAARHHEKLDGSGYPQGLSGERLSVAERIVAVCDIVSALVRKRSYKDAFDKDKVIAILTEQVAANKLCPAVTGAVIDNFDRVTQLSDAYAREALELYDGMKRAYAELLGKIDAVSAVGRRGGSHRSSHNEQTG